MLPKSKMVKHPPKESVQHCGIFYGYNRHVVQFFQFGNLVIAAQCTAHTGSLDKVGVPVSHSFGDGHQMGTLWCIMVYS